MSKNLTTYLVTFKPGLGEPFEVESPSPEAAKLEGLAKYRLRHGLVSFFTVDEVVESATPIL